MILESHRIAVKNSGLASTGILTLSPGSFNTVPGRVKFSLDIRASEDERLMKMEEEMKVAFDAIAMGKGEQTQGRPCQVEWRLDAPSEAVRFDEDCIRCVEESCAGLFGERVGKLTQVMTSGAGM